MVTEKNRLGGLKRAIIILPVVIILMLIGEISYVKYFNAKEHVLEGAEEADGVSVTIAGREDSTSTWLKRGYDLYGKTVDLNAQTMDVNLVNNSKYVIQDWQMRVDIEDDCLINQVWCGTLEIHQNVNGDTKVQTLDLRNYDLEDVTLDYLYDGDLLIPLYKGDYVIYYPSEKNDETPVAKGSELTMGLILYYLDFPQSTTYQVTYHFHRTIMDGHNIYLIIALIVFWLVALLLYVVSDVTYKKTVKELEIKKSGILSLSDMYSIIYIIDLPSDTLTPVVADEESEKLRPKNKGAGKQLQGMFAYDSADSYKELAYEFCDLSTLKERLDGKNTIAFEYVSVNYGWCRTRFFAMDRAEDGSLEKVVFAIQVINEEKKEIESIIHRADDAEHESKAKSTFLANMSHEIRTPINTIIGLNTMILRESKEPAIRSYAKNVGNASNMLLSLINGILDISKIEADKMELVPEKYSFRQLLKDVISMVRTRAEFDRLEFKCNIAENIPDLLYGDMIRLKQVIINLITNAAKYTDEGSVTLTIYGKVHDKQLHLLVSVKDTGIGIREEDLQKLTERFSRFDEKRNHAVEGTGIGLNLVNSILGLMDTELHVISQYGEGSEFYFEVEQEVVDESPIGVFNLEEEDDTDEAYQALFVAPDAKVLVVDDNAMNLTVFTELLKETQVQIDAVSSGRMALEKTKKKKYDLIFMDHMMPEMDGVEAMQAIRDQKDGLNTKTRIIALTANALKGAKEEYCGMGFDDFLAKPIQPEVLEKQMLEYLDPALVHRNDRRTEKRENEIKLPVISGVDVAYGLNHTGGMKSYLAVLKQFETVADTELEELKGYFDAVAADPSDYDNLKNFRIKVHAMKASANIMGAFQVYGVAAMLENAAGSEKTEEVLAVAPYFFEDWEKLKEAVTDSLPKEEKKGVMPSGEDLDSILHLLKTSMNAYDIRSADSLMEKLRSYPWDEEKKKLLAELQNAVANLDAPKTGELCDALKG